MRFRIILAAAVAASVVAAPRVSLAQTKKGQNAKPAPDVKDAKYGPHERNVHRPVEGEVGQADAAGGLHPRRRVPRRRQVEPRAGPAREVPGSGHLGGRDQLPALAARPLPGPDARRRPGRAVPPVEGEGVEHRPEPHRGHRRLGRRGHLAVARLPGRPGRPEERRPGRPRNRRGCRAPRCSGRSRPTTRGGSRRPSAGRPTSTRPCMPFYGLKADELDTPKAHKLYEEASPINFLIEGRPAGLPLLQRAEGAAAGRREAGPGDSPPELRRGTQGEARPAEDRVRRAAPRRLQGEARPTTPNRDMVEFFVKHLGGRK